jgi:transcriptional regulator with XRE-family HTH domain
VTFICATKFPLTTPKKPAIDWKAVGRRLRELRGFDMNQAEFARQIGISQGQLSRYEKGKSEITAEVLLRISQRFGKSIEWVLMGKI